VLVFNEEGVQFITIPTFRFRHLMPGTIKTAEVNLPDFAQKNEINYV
jgi:hypothetical protein